MTGLLVLFLTLALIGFICYLILTYIPMPEPFKQILIVIMVILLILWLIGNLSGNLSLPSLQMR